MSNLKPNSDAEGYFDNEQTKCVLDFMIDNDMTMDADSFVFGFEMATLYAELKDERNVTAESVFHRANETRVLYVINKCGWVLTDRLDVDKTWMALKMERK